MTKKLSKPGIGVAFFDPEAFAEYVRCFTPKTIHASCEDYRACATSDFEMDKADQEGGRKAKMPLLVTWGRKSHTGTVHGDLLPIWKNYAEQVTGGPIECGHYVPEEAPQETLDMLLKHFG
jgi:haloacetate dehalogenase